MAILGQGAAILYGTTAPTNTDVIWAKTTTNDPATWSIVGFFAYRSGGWVDFTTGGGGSTAAPIPSFTSAGDLTAYAGTSKLAQLTFTEGGIPYNFLMQRLTSSRTANGRSIVEHSVNGDVWMRTGGTPIVFIEDLGSSGASSYTNNFLAGYDLNEIKIQTSSGYDLRLSVKSTKTQSSTTFGFNQTIQGKILIEIL